jgi:hypothetical protein
MRSFQYFVSFFVRTFCFTLLFACFVCVCVCVCVFVFACHDFVN